MIPVAQLGGGGSNRLRISKNSKISICMTRGVGRKRTTMQKVTGHEVPIFDALI